jgi:hypothetical protein
MLRLLQKVLELFLVFACLGAIAGGMYYYLDVSGQFKPDNTPKVYNALVIAVTVPNRSLVIYPDGQKTGYDSVQKKDIIEIPKSRYYFQTEENVPGSGAYWLGLTDPPKNFTLQIIGEKGEYYSFGFYSFEKGVQQTQTFSGQFTSGTITTYQVSSAPKNIFPWNVTLIK